MVENFVGGLSAYLQESVFLSFLAVYLGGVLISFTPCIYPVIPITVGFIGARGGSKARSLFLSLIYVLGMAVTYTILGAFAALTGKLFGQLQSNPWTHFIIGNLCILMGLSMFDLFTFSVRTPAFIGQARSKRGPKGISGGFWMGAVSGLVMGPCTAPVFAVILSYAATRQNVAFASGLMFVFACGMGTLLILVGTFAGLLAAIPKSGAWMVRINRLFGCILLGAGEYFLINAGMLWS